MSPVLNGALVVCAATLAAVGGLELVRRLVPSETRQKHNDVAGFIYAALAVIYAVLLALVVIAAWEGYDRARVTVEDEANAAAEIFWLAHWMPQPQGRELQEAVRSYAKEVVDKEWPLMVQGKTPPMKGTRETPSGWVLIDDIRTRLNAFEPHTEAEQDLHAEGLDQIQRLNDARRMRLVAASESMPPILWVVMIFAGVVTVGFTYLFGLANTWAHRLMVGSLASVIALVLFTISSLEHPFYGGTHVSPGAFELILERFETSKLSDLR
jgi:hypothetical protein